MKVKAESSVPLDQMCLSCKSIVIKLILYLTSFPSVLLLDKVRYDKNSNIHNLPVSEKE